MMITNVRIDYSKSPRAPFDEQWTVHWIRSDNTIFNYTYESEAKALNKVAKIQEMYAGVVVESLDKSIKL